MLRWGNTGNADCRKPVDDQGYLAQDRTQSLTGAVEVRLSAHPITSLISGRPASEPT